MPLKTHRYREDLYHLRAHPRSTRPPDFVDSRDSFSIVYFTFLPFLALEYYVELAHQTIPSGLIFPFGYLLFWAFYYTYYRPSFLEEKLAQPRDWNFRDLFSVVLGMFIWVIKVSVVRLGHWAVFQWISHGVKKSVREKTRRSAQSSYNQAPPRPPHRPRQAPQPPPGLPTDIRLALRTLGLSENADWGAIHHRYRELAKKLHPDLNPDLTDFGHRFIQVDGAYRKLSSVRQKYFAAKRAG